MATLRDFAPGHQHLGSLSSLAPGLPGTAPASVTEISPEVKLRQAQDEEIVRQVDIRSLGEVEKGYHSGRIQDRANWLANEEAVRAAAGDTAGAADARRRITALQQEAALYAPKEQDVTQLDWDPGRVLNYAAGAIGSTAASMQDGLLSGAGLRAASAVTGFIPTPWTQGASKVLGAASYAVPFATNYLSNAGETYNEMAQDKELMGRTTATQRLLSGAGTGLAMGALDTFGDLSLIRRGLGGTFGKVADKALDGGGAVVRTAKDSLLEGGTELAQTGLQKGTLGLLNPTRDTSGDSADYWNALAQGTIGSAPLSGAANTIQSVRETVQGRLGDEADKDAGSKRGDEIDLTTGKTISGGDVDGETLLRAAGTKGSKFSPEQQARRDLVDGAFDVPDDPAQMAARVIERQEALLDELGRRGADPQAAKLTEALMEVDPSDPLANDHPAMKAAADYVRPYAGMTDEQLAKAVKNLGAKGRKLSTYVPADDMGGAAGDVGGIDTSKMPAADQAKFAARQTAMKQIEDNAKNAASLMEFAFMGGRGDKRAPVNERKAFRALGEAIATMAHTKGEPTPGQIFTAERYGRILGSMLRGGDLQATMQQVGYSTGAEGSPLFSAMLGSAVRASGQMTRESLQQEKLSRDAAADQMVALIPKPTLTALTNKGVNLQGDDNQRQFMLDGLESFFQDGDGPFTEAKLTAMLGKETLGKLKELFDAPIEPNFEATTRSDVRADADVEDRALDSDDEGGEFFGDGDDATDFDKQSAQTALDKSAPERLVFSHGKKDAAADMSGVFRGAVARMRQALKQGVGLAKADLPPLARLPQVRDDGSWDPDDMLFDQDPDAQDLSLPVGDGGDVPLPANSKLWRVAKYAMDKFATGKEDVGEQPTHAVRLSTATEEMDAQKVPAESRVDMMIGYLAKAGKMSDSDAQGLYREVRRMRGAKIAADKVNAVLTDKSTKPLRERAAKHLAKGDLEKMLGMLSPEAQERVRAKVAGATSDATPGVLPKSDKPLDVGRARELPAESADAEGRRAGERLQQLIDDIDRGLGLSGFTGSKAERLRTTLLALAKELKSLQAERAESLRGAAGLVVPDGDLDAAAKSFFDERFMVVAEKKTNRDFDKMSATEVEKLVVGGQERLDAARHAVAGIADPEAREQARRKILAEEGTILFVRKGKEVAVRAGDLVNWSRNALFSSSTNENTDARDLATRKGYINHLSQGIAALLDSGSVPGDVYTYGWVGRLGKESKRVARRVLADTESALADKQVRDEIAALNDRRNAARRAGKNTSAIDKRHAELVAKLREPGDTFQFPDSFPIKAGTKTTTFGAMRFGQEQRAEWRVGDGRLVDPMERTLLDAEGNLDRSETATSEFDDGERDDYAALDAKDDEGDGFFIPDLDRNLGFERDQEERRHIKQFSAPFNAAASSTGVAPTQRGQDLVATAESAPKEHRPKERAKLTGVDLVIAPTSTEGFAGTLGRAAQALGKLFVASRDANLTGKTVVVSVPGKGRNFGGMETLIKRVKLALDRGAAVRTDNETNATSSHNAVGEGALRQALLAAGYVETPGKLFSTWRAAGTPEDAQVGPAAPVQDSATGRAVAAIEQKLAELQEKYKALGVSDHPIAQAMAKLDFAREMYRTIRDDARIIHTGSAVRPARASERLIDGPATVIEPAGRVTFGSTKAERLATLWASMKDAQKEFVGRFNRAQIRAFERKLSEADALRAEGHKLRAEIDALEGSGDRKPSTYTGPSESSSIQQLSDDTADAVAAKEAKPAKAQVKPINVWHGSGENAQLSNLAARPFEVGGKKYLSVEHAYQSWKSGKFDQATYDKYKVAGRKIVGTLGTKTENGWNIRLMERIVKASFEQNPDAAAALLATGNAPITHTQDAGVWKTEFPRILEKVRSELASKPAEPAPADQPTSKVDQLIKDLEAAVAAKPDDDNFTGPEALSISELTEKVMQAATRLVERMQAFGTAAARDLAARTSELRDRLDGKGPGHEDFTDNALDTAKLYREVAAYAKEYAAHQDELFPRKLSTYAPDAENATQAAQDPVTRPAPSDSDLERVRAHLTRMLGDKIKVVFEKAFDAQGEWIEAEKTIKLAITSITPMLSTANHEALHAFFSGILANHPEARDLLLGLVQNPRHLDRLEAILAQGKGGNKAAIASMRSSPEEALAYTFQFWAEGILPIDKKPQGMLQKIQRFLREVFGLVRDSEKALDIFQALYDGKMAEPSAAQKALDGIMAQGERGKRARMKADKQVEWLRSTAMTSHHMMRNSASTTMRDIAAKFFTNPGSTKLGTEPGILNRRDTENKRWSNELQSILNGLSDEDLASMAQHDNERKWQDHPDPGLNRRLQALYALTHRFRNEYLLPAGIELGMRDVQVGADGQETHRYTPMVWDVQALVGKKDEFSAMLLQEKYAGTMGELLATMRQSKPEAEMDDVVDAIFQLLIDRNGVEEAGKLDAQREDGVLSPFFAAENVRKLDWLDPADRGPFLSQDLIYKMSAYLHQGVRAAEYVRTWGPGGKLLKELLQRKGDVVGFSKDGPITADEDGPVMTELREAAAKEKVPADQVEAWVQRRYEDETRAIGAQEGVLGKNIGDNMRKLNSGLMAYQNARLLPLAIFASMLDPNNILVSGGKLDDMIYAYVRGMKSVWRNWKNLATGTELAPETDRDALNAMAVGAIDNNVFLERQGNVQASEYMTSAAHRFNSKFFLANGLTMWDRQMRVSATRAGMAFIERNLRGEDKDSERKLQALGLTADQAVLGKDGKLVVDPKVLATQRAAKKAGEGWSKATPEQRRQWALNELKQAREDLRPQQDAVKRFVQRSVLSPNAAQRPAWASDPHFASLFHLKSFTYSFQETILTHAAEEAEAGNYRPGMQLLTGIPIMIAADITKALITGGGSLPGYMANWGVADWVMHGFARAGLGGIGEIGMHGLGDPTSLLGPSVDQVWDTATNAGEKFSNLDMVPGLRILRPDLGLDVFSRAP